MYTYLDYCTRRLILDSGLTQYQIDLMQGDLPEYLIFMMTNIDRISGDDTLSLTRFEQCGLESFTLLCDQEAVQGFPLSGQGPAGFAFYQNYLRQTNRFVEKNTVKSICYTFFFYFLDN